MHHQTGRLVHCRQILVFIEDTQISFSPLQMDRSLFRLLQKDLQDLSLREHVRNPYLPVRCSDPSFLEFQSADLPPAQSGLCLQHLLNRLSGLLRLDFYP